MEKLGLGIEITDQVVLLALISQAHGQLKVHRVKRVSLPPRLVVDGEITDTDSFQELLARVFHELGVSKVPVHVGIRTKRYIKRVIHINQNTVDDMTHAIESEISNSVLFSRENFQYAYQASKERSGSSHPLPLFFIAADKTKVDAITDWAQYAHISLESLESSSVSATRLIAYNQDSDAKPIICLFIDESGIDFSLLFQGEIILTHFFRKDTNFLLEDVFFHEEVSKRLNHFLLAVSNIYPNNLPPETLFWGSSIFPSEVLIQFLKRSFPTLSFRSFNWSTVQIDGQASARELSEETLSGYFPAIGLGIKSLDNVVAKNINLHKIKRHIVPFFEKKQVLVLGGILLGLLLMGFSAKLYITALISKQLTQIEAIKLRSKNLQSGESSLRQKKLSELKQRDKALEPLLQSVMPRVGNILESVSNPLPEDVSFSMLKINSNDKILIKASAYYQGSVYRYYNKLKSKYPSTSISGIESGISDIQVPEHRFSLELSWSPK